VPGREDSQDAGEVVQLPAAPASPTEIALEELERIYAFAYRRVGNRADAEDLTQQVALKAVPRLRAGASTASIRAYLFATARTELARFWATRFGLPVEELHEHLHAGAGTWEEESHDAFEETDAMAAVARILDQLPTSYARLLELRFLRGYSTKEIARELGSTVGGVRIMQLRALRAAARVSRDGCDA
jgi:RNA polymerase sigma-70 factor (ECF subfamily)